MTFAVSDFEAECAVAFLLNFDPTGWHNLVAIHPEKGTVAGRTFAPGLSGEMADWIGRYNGTHNLYFTVNEPRPDAPDNKLKKADIGAVRAIYADVDPAKDADPDAERGRLRLSPTRQTRT